MLPPIPRSWRFLLRDATSGRWFGELDAFLERDARRHTICPRRDEIFRALELTPFDAVKVVLLGQDPYAGPGLAHGLAFSVRPGVRPPGSLRNIFKELETDVGFRAPNHGCLEAWAAQGVLLLNTVLTVREREPNSHGGIGWEQFTDAIIRRIAERPSPAVFVLWGAAAQRKARLIDPRRHTIVTAAHPSPLAARRGFFGSRPFSRVNVALERAGQRPIDWRLPDLPGERGHAMHDPVDPNAGPGPGPRRGPEIPR